jgi:hypothetical protein
MTGIRICASGVFCAMAISFAAMAASPAPAPDISGTYWATSYSPRIQVLGGGDPPLNDAGKAAYAMIQAGLKDGSIVDKARKVCVPDGVPRVLATPFPFEIFQTPADQVTFLYEMNHQTRTILMNRPLPKLDSLVTQLSYQGHSVGRWEGEFLVVETTGYNDRTFVDATGLPHSESMSTVERIRRLDDRLEDVVTIHDPEMYTRDWLARFVYGKREDIRLEDYACNDAHRDLSSVFGTIASKNRR